VDDLIRNKSEVIFEASRRILDIPHQNFGFFKHENFSKTT
jgi:hypothetical protein